MAIELATVNLIKQRSRTGLVSFNKRFKCVDNSHFSTTDYYCCSVKRSPAAKLIQYYLYSSRANLRKLVYCGSQAVVRS